jgi:hypothetical protein
LDLYNLLVVDTTLPAMRASADEESEDNDVACMLFMMVNRGDDLMNEMAVALTFGAIGVVENLVSQTPLDLGLLTAVQR